MKAIASILCLYLFGLCLQPALFPLHQKMAGEMSCCTKKNKNTHKDCPGTKKDGCCDSGQCNPFFSQCPICAMNAVPGKKYMLPQHPGVYYTGPEYFLKNDHRTSQYQADLLRPPQIV